MTEASSRYSKQALQELYEAHSPALFRYAYRLLGDADLAEECVAETFSRLLLSVKNGGGPSDNARAYLYRVAHNWITDSYRRQKSDTALAPDYPDDPGGHPPAVVARLMEGESVRIALQKLTAEQRQVIVLRYLEGWSHDQIASAIGKTAEAARALHQRAIHTLRSLLKDQENQP